MALSTYQISPLQWSHLQGYHGVQRLSAQLDVSLHTPHVCTHRDSTRAFSLSLRLLIYLLMYLFLEKAIFNWI